jgi:dihydroxy-acid dehydratase
MDPASEKQVMSKKSNKKSEKPRTRGETLHPQGRRFRSQFWFDNPNDPNMTALYFERYLNFGLTEKEIIGGRPIIGIAQTGSDLSPCNRHHMHLAQRVREGIRDAGGIALEFSCHPIQETGKRPTAALDRNLSYLSLVEVLFGYPIDALCLPPAATRPRQPRSWPPPRSTFRPSCCRAGQCSTAGGRASAPVPVPSNGN